MVVLACTTGHGFLTGRKPRPNELSPKVDDNRTTLLGRLQDYSNHIWISHAIEWHMLALPSTSVNP